MNKILLGMAAASALAITSTANASFVMFLDDLSTPGIDKIVMDNAAAGTATGGAVPYNFSTDADIINVVDAIAFAGSVGVFNVNITSATTKTATNNPVEMSLTTNSTSNAAGTLVIGVSDTDFLVDQAYNFELSSTGVGNTLTATGYQDPANALFGLINATSLLSLTGSGFDADYNFSTAPGTPFSLSMITTITHDTAETTNSTSSFKVPEPSILALFGAGLFGLGLTRRRMKK